MKRRPHTHHSAAATAAAVAAVIIVLAVPPGPTSKFPAGANVAMTSQAMRRPMCVVSDGKVCYGADDKGVVVIRDVDPKKAGEILRHYTNRPDTHGIHAAVAAAKTAGFTKVGTMPAEKLSELKPHGDLPRPNTGLFIDPKAAA